MKTAPGIVLFKNTGSLAILVRRKLKRLKIGRFRAARNVNDVRITGRETNNKPATYRFRRRFKITVLQQSGCPDNLRLNYVSH